MERERAYLLTPTRAYTRFINLFVQSDPASSRTVWRGPKERLVNSVILIAVSPLRGFLYTSTADGSTAIRFVMCLGIHRRCDFSTAGGKHRHVCEESDGGHVSLAVSIHSAMQVTCKPLVCSYVRILPDKCQYHDNTFISPTSWP